MVVPPFPGGVCTSPEPEWMPETMDGIEPYIDYVFSYHT